MTPSLARESSILSRFSGRQKALMAGAILLFVLLGAGSAANFRPWIDEAWYGTPAITLVHQGFMGTPCFDSATFGFQRIDRYSYWIMPVFPLVQSIWGHIVPLTVRSMRVLSILSNLTGILCWAYLLLALTKNRLTIVFFMLIASCDYVLNTAAGTARPDAMAFGFQALAFASFIALRQRNLTWAVFASQTFVVLSGMTHPNGGMLSFIGVLVLTLSFDRRQLRIHHFVVGAIPYLIGGLGWGLYILQDPHAFFSQYGYQTSGRLDGVLRPWKALQGELLNRYGLQMGLGDLIRSGMLRFTALKAVMFIAYFVSVGAVLAIRNLREQLAGRVLLRLLGTFLLWYLFMEMTKECYYFTYLTMVYTAFVALFFTWMWEQRKVPRPLLAVVLAGLMLVQIGGELLRMKYREYREYQTMAEWLERHARPEDRINGSLELGFLIGFTPRFLDDPQFGLRNGSQPDFIVMEMVYDDRMEMYRQKDAARYAAIQQRLSEYHLVYQRRQYSILMRNTHPPVSL